MKSPRYSEKDIEELEKELAKAVNDENGWVDASVYLGKKREVVSVYVGNKIPVKPHYRKINGKRVYVKAHYRKKPKHAKKTKP